MERGAEHARWIHAKLVAERVQRGWSLQQTARAISKELGRSLAKQSYTKWESFETQPKLDELAAWARAFGMRLEVDLVWPEEDAVSARLPVSVAAIARELGLLRPAALAPISLLIEQLKPADTTESSAGG